MRESHDTKLCNQCERVRPLKKFSPDVKGRKGRASKCKECRTWNRKHKYDSAYKRKYDLEKAYGLTLDQYDELLKAQGSICAVCGTNTPDGKGRFVVDHDHETGNVRGLLCNRCNVMLGMALDSQVTLQAAIHYLEQHKDN